MKRRSLVVAMVLLAGSLGWAQVRVVCVGNSITEGWGLANASAEAYPTRLAELLGPGYRVLNCGVSGSCMVKTDPASYWNTNRFTEAKYFDPQIVIIKLGTNDGDPPRWRVHKDEFYNDYVAMIAEFRKGGRNPVIYVSYPVPCFGPIKAPQDSTIKNEVIPRIRQVAASQGVGIIDFNLGMQPYSNMFPDGVHPNADGAKKMAEIAFRALVPATPTLFQSCDYHGYYISLDRGDYSFLALQVQGLSKKDISSIKVPTGYEVIVYTKDNFKGKSQTLTADNTCLGEWDGIISSVRVKSNVAAKKASPSK